MTTKPRPTKNRWVRPLIQVFFFVLVALIAVNHTLPEESKIPYLSSASLHAICPFGGVVGIYQYVTTGTLVQKTHASSAILMYIVFAILILFGPVICGWVCPLGSLQEWIGNLGRKLFGKRHNNFIPKKVDQALRYLRYGVLAMVIYQTAVTAKLMFAEIDPYFALFNFWTSEVAVGGLVVLGATLVASLFVERPFCKYGCPYGALSGLFNLVKPFAVRRNSTTCINCKACDRACPMNIEVSTSGAVRDHQCISCMRCSFEDACPVSDTVTLSLRGVDQP